MMSLSSPSPYCTAIQGDKRQDQRSMWGRRGACGRPNAYTGDQKSIWGTRRASGGQRSMRGPKDKGSEEQGDQRSMV